MIISSIFYSRSNRLIFIGFSATAASNPSSPAENGIDSNENSSSAMDQAMAATLAAIEVPEPQEASGKHPLRIGFSFYFNIYQLFSQK